MDPSLQPGLGRGRLAVTGTMTVEGSHQGLTLDVTSGTFSIAFTAVATLGANFHCFIYNSGSGVATLDPNASETIRTATGTATTLALTQGQGVCLLCDGSAGFDVIAAIGLPAAPATALTVYDNALTIQDNVTPTKQAQFQCSSISAATTRTYTLSDADQILAGSVAALTSGKIPKAFTGGLLEDSAIDDNGTGTVAITDRDLRINSASPLIWLYETDVGVDSKTWMAYSTGGTLRLATGNDSGGISTVVLDITRTALTPGTMTISGVAAVTMSSVNFSITGSGTFSTNTGSHSLNGNVTIAATRILGFGAASSSAACFLSSTFTGTTGVSQYGFRASLNGTSAATSFIIGFGATPTTVAASYTCAALVGIANFIGGITAGAGSTITRSAGSFCQTITAAGTANHCYYIGTGGALTGSGNWGAYFDCALPNYLGTGATYIGTTAAINTDEIFQAIKSTTATAAVTPGIVTGANSTGTAAAGFGVSHLWTLESTTTNNTSAAEVDVVWATATHASRKARVDHIVYDTAARTAMQLGTDGAAATVTFPSANPIISGSATLLQTSVALTNGAAAAAGTLLNAPAAGNPTKWIPINDNGTTRYIPAW